MLAERVGFEPTVGYKPTPIFKTGAINQLDHLSISLTNIFKISCDSIYINIFKNICQYNLRYFYFI